MPRPWTAVRLLKAWADGEIVPPVVARLQRGEREDYYRIETLFVSPDSTVKSDGKPLRLEEFERLEHEGHIRLTSSMSDSKAFDADLTP